MSVNALPNVAPPYVPFSLAGRALSVRGAALVAATAFLALCSWVSVPMVPVPVTMQSFGVTVVAALFGWRLGTLAILAWLAEGALGLPVLASGHAGLPYMVGPTGGYLLAFALSGLLLGVAAERGHTSRSLVSSFGVMLVANAMILAVGGVWLAHFVGLDRAAELGVIPFVLGGILKAALASCVIEAARRHLPAL